MVLTLAISCLPTFNLLWFMDLTFQVPMQYCSLQNQTLFPSPVTSTTGHFFPLGSISSLFLELFLHSSAVACCHQPIWGVHLSVSYCFCLCMPFMGFSWQKYWSGLPFPSPVDHALSEYKGLAHVVMEAEWSHKL